MTSKKKIAANRRNARQSGGPKTAQGKATASMHAVRHGPRARAAIFGHMTQITSRLERVYFNSYKELERIKTAREKQPEQPQQSKPAEPSQGSQGKKEKYKHPPKLEVRWVKPASGESEVLFRSEYGKPVKEFSDASPPSDPKDLPL